jgi:DhnA family fructose-bisphosphate aldolase class Ia
LDKFGDELVWGRQRQDDFAQSLKARRTVWGSGAMGSVVLRRVFPACLVERMLHA